MAMVEPSSDVLDDLATRFIYSAPPQHLEDFTQMMFLVESAYWFYEDQLRENFPTLRHFSKLSDFASMLFTRCHLLAKYKGQLNNILDAWRAYKRSIPVYGAILLDHSLERVLLLRGFKTASGWGFPRGKINRSETEPECAIREVLEETSYDIEGQLREGDFLAEHLDGKLHKLYIITGLDPDSTKFAPKCKSEVGAYAWHRISDLPSTREEGDRVFVTDDGTRHKFFAVAPFVRKLRTWVSRNKSRASPTPLPHKPATAATPVPPAAAPQQRPAASPDSAATSAAPPQQHPAASLASNIPSAAQQRPAAGPTSSPFQAAAVAGAGGATPGQTVPGPSGRTASVAITAAVAGSQGGRGQGRAGGTRAAAQGGGVRGVAPAAAANANGRSSLRDFKFDRDAIFRALTAVM